MESTPEEIQFLLKEMATDRRAIRREVADICWYMRGGITWEESWQLCQDDKIEIHKVIKYNIERTEKSRMPLL